MITVHRLMQWQSSRRVVEEMERQKKCQKNGQKISRSQSRHRRNRRVLLMAVLLFALLGSAAAVSCYGFPTPIQARLDIRPEKYARKGTLTSGETRNVEFGSFRVILNQLPTVETGSRDCNIEYENPEVNHYSSRISLYLKENGKLIGGTTRVDPGYYVESIRLKKSLPAGEYPVTVRIELFENKTPAGEMSIDITLRIVENREGGAG